MDAPLDSGGFRPALDVDAERWPDISRVFAAAVELDPSARSSFLDKACSDDPELRSAVESLLAAHVDAGSFGDTIPVALPSATKRLAPGSQLGPFRVETLVGAGGMGEVYRAYDTKLGRAVALKVLPDSFANDADRLGRFEEEARALAALNHPHIGAIHGVQESGNVAALVLELVDGITLAERLAAGPIPFQEVVHIARQLADGLEAAHDRGIVHRDFKPANIKITPDGNVKILDFGLAKVEGWAARDGLVESQSPTQSPSRRTTAAGVIVGTAAYMSPEQARGQAVDKRADIWAFGCVLFEMCAVGPPFPGATAREIRTAVIEREPEWQQLRPDMPLALERILRRCLVEDPKLRLRDIGEARIALAESGESIAPPGKSRNWTPVIVGTALALAALLAVAIYATRIPPLRVAFPVFPPNGGRFSLHVGRTFFALSPDASRLAFIASTTPASIVFPGGGNQIWIREMANLEPQRLVGTDAAIALFWSPDGRSLAFVANRQLKRINLADGTVIRLCDLPASPSWNGSWGTGGTILLSTGDGTEIQSVSADGGELKTVLKINLANREARVHWPWFLPDGRRFLYTARLNDGDGELRIGTLDGSSRRIMSVASNAQWGRPDVVVFARDGALMGQRVDVDAAQPVGEPFTMARRVEYFGTTSRAAFSVSLSGAIAYHEGGEVAQFVWMDGKGNESAPFGTPAEYEMQSGWLSPDGTKLLTARREGGGGTYDIWQIDLVRNSEDQITSGPGSELTPVWIDQSSIIFAADSNGSLPRLFRKDLVTDTDGLLFGGGVHQLAMQVVGDSVVYVNRLEGGQFQLLQRPLWRGDPVPVAKSESSAFEARISPDGRAIAYIAYDGSRRVLSVGPLPMTSAAALVAVDVWSYPRWSSDGSELYYLTRGAEPGASATMTSVSIRTTPSLEIGMPRRLFDLKRPASLVQVARDGRFLMLVPSTRASSNPIVLATQAILSTAR